MSKRKMVTYDLIKELKNQGLFSQCISTGIISFNYSNWCDIYEFYKLKRLSIDSKMQCYTDTATQFGVCEKVVRRVVSRFED